MDSLIEFIKALGSMSPLAVIALLGTVIWMLVKGKTAAGRQIREVQTNHLHDLPEMLETLRSIESALQRIEVKMSEDFSYLKARINGGRK